MKFTIKPEVQYTDYAATVFVSGAINSSKIKVVDPFLDDNKPLSRFPVGIF